MKRNLTTALLAATALTFSNTAVQAQEADMNAAETEAQTEDQRLAAFFQQIFERNVANSPIFQAQLGMKTERYGEWDDFSDEEAIRQYEEVIEDLERLRATIDYDSLNEQSQVSYRIFEFLQERTIADHPYRFHGYAFSTMNNPITFPVTFLQNIHRVDDVSDAEAYISRLAGSERPVDQLIEGIDMAAARGIVPTSFSFAPVVADAQNIISGVPFDDSEENAALLDDFTGKVEALEIDDSEKARLIAEASAAMTDNFKPAVERFIAKVQSVEAQSHGPNGVWALPDGRKYYENRIAFWTTESGLTANQVHRIGLNDVKRIRREMETIKDQVEFDGTLQEFFDFVRTDPSNYFPNTEEGKQAYIDASKQYIDEIYEEVGEYFNVLPKAPLEVRAVEAWREETAPIAFYSRPSPDGSRPGIYYTNTKDMSEKQKHEMETVAYHEGAPGHHFQLAIQQELTGVPMFQKFAFFGAYSEGWGLYSERLAKEKGRFTDPMQDFGRLHNEIWRAVRLVVDTGLHSKKWSREKAIAYMMANSPITEADASKEVERYIDLPGQALSYKIGMIKILDLRDKAEAELGDKYDIRDFHDVVLKNGAVALPILEQLVDAYIAEKKAS